MPTSQPSAKQIIDIAKEAGKAILEIYGSEFNVDIKQDKSPLTDADMASHHLIVKHLERIAPGIPILSEESANIPFTTRKQWQRYWLIDPLDGTKEFIKRNGEFTVNIALIEDGKPILGVVHVPVTGVTYYGEPGKIAYRLDGDNQTAIRVAGKGQTLLRVVGSRSHAGESLQQFLARVGDHEMVSMGSSLKLCLVAEGKADIYPRLGPTSEWDTAAAQAVVEAAGGQVTTTDLQPLTYNTKDSLLNPHFLVFGDSTVDWSRFLAE